MTFSKYKINHYSDNEILNEKLKEGAYIIKKYNKIL